MSIGARAIAPVQQAARVDPPEMANLGSALSGAETGASPRGKKERT